MRYFISIFFLVISSAVISQDTLTTYHDIDWAPTTKERSYYYTNLTKKGDLYEVSSYFSKGNALRAKGTYQDTLLQRPVGETMTYYRSGVTEDSVIYRPDGSVLESFHFYENKELAGHYYVIETTKKEVTEGFDENGLKIKNYILRNEASFPGGEEAWKAFLVKNMKKDMLVRGTEQQKFTALILFYIDETGNVKGVKVQQASGNPLVDKDAVGVITASPPWKNAILYNKPVKAFRLQPMTYVLEPMRKK